MINSFEILYKSEAFQSFFQHSSQTLILKANSPHFTVLAVSDNGLNLVHKQRIELLGKSLFEVFPGSAKDSSGQNDVINSFNRVIETGSVDELPNFKYEIFVQEKNLYETFYWTNINQPVIEDGKVAFIINTTTNITEIIKQQKAFKEAGQREELLNTELAVINAELDKTHQKLHSLNSELEQRVQKRTEQLEESENRFQTIIQSSPIGMLVTRGDDMILEEFNHAMLSIFEKNNSIKGKPWFEVIPELKVQIVFDNLYHTYKTGEKIQLEEVPITFNKNGETRTCFYNINYSPLIENGIIAGIIQFVVDVTEQVHFRKEIANAIERLNVAIDAGNFGTTEVDLATGNMVCNERFKILFGRNKDQQMTYADMFEAMLPKYRENIRTRSKKAQAEHSLYEAIYEIAWPDGSLHWIEAHGRARYDKEDKADRMVGILADVTEQITARNLLEQAEAKLRLATEAAALGSWYINAETLEFYPSGRLKELFGYHPEDVMPYEAAINQIAASHRDKVVQAVNAAINEGTNYEIEYPIIGFHDKKIRWVRATGRLFKAHDAKPSHFSGVMVDISEQVASLKALQESEEKLNIAIETGKMGTWSIETSTLKPTLSDFVRNMLGIALDTEVTMDMIMAAINPEYHEMLLQTLKNAVENGKSSDTEYEITNLQSGEGKWVKATATVLHDNEGKPVEYTGIFMDITERKVDELRKNDFIGMVSHELKTPLTSLNAYLQLLQRKATKAEDTFTLNALDQSVKQVRRMTTMINGFLNVSRLESGKINIDKQRFNMAELVRESEAEIIPMYSFHHIIFAPVEEIFVMADRDKIGQVINNFISNAVKYSKPGSTVNVACVSINDFVMVSVKDEGIGIEQNEIKKLFERYYRVEGNNQVAGFGIGLYLCYEIIERHHGKVWAESEIGKGSTFYFQLPLANEHA